MKPSQISKNLYPAVSFGSLANYFGVAISFNDAVPVSTYADIERFFLAATLNLQNSRVTEGILCWLKEYGHLLSPSKIRKFIREGEAYDPSHLGTFLEFMRSMDVDSRPLGILDKFTAKQSKLTPLFVGPRVRKPAAYFLKYNILAPNFSLDREKFLKPRSVVMKSCSEIRNRSLFGSVLNSDVASALVKNSNLNPYALAKMTGHHKANVFKNFRDIKDALSLKVSGVT